MTSGSLCVGFFAGGSAVKQILFALFDRQETLNNAINDLESAGIPSDRFNIVLHPDNIEETDLNFSESDLRGGLLRGIVIGCVLGVLVGWLLTGPFPVWEVPFWTAALFGAFVFSVFGALGGAIAGAALPDGRMKHLAGELREGQVLVTAEVDGPETHRALVEIFERHGAVRTVGHKNMAS